jgi:hypothetical protein
VGWSPSANRECVSAARARELDRYSRSRLAAPLCDGTGDRLVATLHYPAVPTPTKAVMSLYSFTAVGGSEDSGYMLSSAVFFLVLHRTWPDLQRMKLLTRVVVARSYRVSFFLVPQYSS